jgi:hypothetical protein
MSTRNIPGIKRRPARRTGSLDVSQSYGPPRRITGITLPLMLRNLLSENEENHEIVRISGLWDEICRLNSANTKHISTQFTMMSVMQKVSSVRGQEGRLRFPFNITWPILQTQRDVGPVVRFHCEEVSTKAKMFHFLKRMGRGGGTSEILFTNLCFSRLKLNLLIVLDYSGWKNIS